MDMTTEEKVDYIYETLKKFEAIFEQMGPILETVSPMLGMMGGFSFEPPNVADGVKLIGS